MLAHVSLAVTDIARAKRFYDPTMAALGYVLAFAHERAFGYGIPGDPPDQDRLALLLRPVAPAGDGVHLALAASSAAAVDAFHAAAVASGGTDNGPPGIRAHYGPTYYAAFVLDPDGNHLEAVYKG